MKTSPGLLTMISNSDRSSKKRASGAISRRMTAACVIRGSWAVIGASSGRQFLVTRDGETARGTARSRMSVRRSVTRSPYTDEKSRSRATKMFTDSPWFLLRVGGMVMDSWTAASVSRRLTKRENQGRTSPSCGLHQSWRHARAADGQGDEVHPHGEAG